MVFLSASSYVILLVFGDYYDPPNCLALTLELRVDFQTTFGTGVQMAQLVRVRDVFAIKDPRKSEDTLGESITILPDL